MVRLLYSLRQDSDQRWRWFGFKPGTDHMVESHRSWEQRLQAQEALNGHLNACAMFSFDTA